MKIYLRCVDFGAKRLYERDCTSCIIVYSSLSLCVNYFAPMDSLFLFKGLYAHPVMIIIL